MCIEPKPTHPEGEAPAEPWPSPESPDLLATAISRIDEENARDPRTIRVHHQSIPFELFYSQRLTHWVHQLDPAPSEPLLLAARCQHVARWRVPRASYPMNRAGYLKWRANLKRYHADLTTGILADVGYHTEDIDRVRSLNLKENLGTDPDTQTLEDALCLVTIEQQLDDLLEKTDRTKLVNILRKTWTKMSPSGHAHAATIPVSPEAQALLTEALASS